MSESSICSQCGETFKVLHSCTSIITKDYCPQHRIYSCLCSYPKIEVNKLPESHWQVIADQQKQEPGTKFDSGKPRMELLPQKALLEIAQVLTFGSKKYEAWNWAKGMSWTRLIGAALRHIAAWSVGETKDPETGLNHLSHAACDLLFLLEYQHFRQEFDNRYKFENKVDK